MTPNLQLFLDDLKGREESPFEGKALKPIIDRIERTDHLVIDSAAVRNHFSAMPIQSFQAIRRHVIKKFPVSVPELAVVEIEAPMTTLMLIQRQQKQLNVMFALIQDEAVHIHGNGYLRMEAKAANLRWTLSQSMDPDSEMQLKQYICGRIIDDLGVSLALRATSAIPLNGKSRRLVQKLGL